MSTSSVFTFGLNHVSAPLSIRERVAFPLEQLKPALEGLRATFGQQIHEATILSTCNRTEIYCAATPNAREHIPQWLADFSQLQNNSLLPHLYELEHDKAVRHAFRVASGLDSMVLGEPQILGQLKSAVRIANDAGALGTVLHQLFQRTFSVAKEVRTQTAIGAESVSMAAASVRLAQRVFGDLSTVKVLCIGAGEMIGLCATHMSAQNPLEMVVANRTIERAEQLAQRVNAQTMKLSELPERLAEFDVIISCTASSLPILGLGLVERAAKKRRHRPIVMVDLAVPRDIEPEVARLSDVYLYTVDDLGEMTQSAANSRQAAVIQAEAIIDTRVQHFIHWMDNRALIPTINAIQDQAQTINQLELERAQEALARGEDPQAVIESLTRRLSQKYLHGTLSTLNRSSAEEREVLTHLAPRLFTTRHHSPHHH